MTDTEEAPTLAERYGRATTSSHLKLKETRCDVDYLIAAGWLKDGLGTLLFRLRGEYDAARAEIVAGEANLPTWEERAKEAEHVARTEELACRPPLALSTFIGAEPARIRAEAARYALTVRALALINLKSLHAAKEAVGTAAIVLATQQLFMQKDAVVLAMAGRALDAWLDPNCPTCEGRGVNGGTHRGERTVKCGGCRSTGKRRAMLGETVEERRFARLLLDKIEAHHGEVEVAMRARLRNNEPHG